MTVIRKTYVWDAVTGKFHLSTGEGDGLQSFCGTTLTGGVPEYDGDDPDGFTMDNACDPCYDAAEA